MLSEMASIKQSHSKSLGQLEAEEALELAEKALIAQGLLSILSGESPRFLVDRLNVQLPPSERFQEAG